MSVSPGGPERIFLVGPMGAGKTSVGRQLARALELDFVDADHEVERRAGVDISTIFEFEGESGFRRRERLVIDELTQRDGVVLATGGGAVLDPANRRDLTERGLVVYLETSVTEQLRRTRRGHDRPLLQSSDRRATLERLYEERDPLYREVADIIVETNGRRRRTTVDRILARLADRA